MESFLTPYGLSNAGQEKLQFTPFWDGPKPVCSDGLRTGTIENHNFFVLGPILVKFHIRTRLIESFPTIFQTWWCGEEKLHFTPVHTLCQLKCDEGLFPPFRRVAEFRARYRQISVRGFLGVGKFWRPCDLWSRSYNRLYTHGHTHAHTHAGQLIYTSKTCVVPRTFKGFWKLYGWRSLVEG